MTWQLLYQHSSLQGEPFYAVVLSALCIYALTTCMTPHATGAIAL